MADLDLVVVWEDKPPPESTRAGLELSDGGPEPEFFDEAGFVLDRFWLAGQQIDVKHVSAREVRSWAEGVEEGGGTSGYPMPAIALHGLQTGDVLTDPAGQCEGLRARIEKIPAAFRVRTAGVFDPRQVDTYLDNLAACVERSDGLLFYGLATDLLRRAYIAWFSEQGVYWPHEKRLRVRFVRLGRADLADGDDQIWFGTLAEALEALRNQLTRLAGDLGTERASS